MFFSLVAHSCAIDRVEVSMSRVIPFFSWLLVPFFLVVCALIKFFFGPSTCSPSLAEPGQRKAPLLAEPGLRKADVRDFVVG